MGHPAVGAFVFNIAGCAVDVGHLKAAGDANLPRLLSHLEGPDFVALTETPLDGKPLAESSKVLITACGRCQNTGMQFTPDRRSVGRNWGKAPVQIGPAEGLLYLDFIKPGNWASWTCRAVKPDGSAGEEVEIVRPKEGPLKITLAAKYGTMWYLLERH
jgi:hypothetical protein